MNKGTATEVLRNSGHPRFATLDLPEETRATASYESHSGGWTEVLATMREHAERLTT
jgi:hypothetical protein